jgi:hypothetical protein
MGLKGKRMSNRVHITLVCLYGIGILVDWAYWISVGWELHGGTDYVGPAVLGWVPSIFWPLHLGASLWEWLL